MNSLALPQGVTIAADGSVVSNTDNNGGGGDVASSSSTSGGTNNNGVGLGEIVRRSSVVRYMCSPDSKVHMVVTEPTQCQYVVDVYVPSLCGIKGMGPIRAKPDQLVGIVSNGSVVGITTKEEAISGSASASASASAGTSSTNAVDDDDDPYLDPDDDIDDVDDKEEEEDVDEDDDDYQSSTNKKDEL